MSKQTGMKKSSTFAHSNKLMEDGLYLYHSWYFVICVQWLYLMKNMFREGNYKSVPWCQMMPRKFGVKPTLYSLATRNMSFICILYHCVEYVYSSTHIKDGCSIYHSKILPVGSTVYNWCRHGCQNLNLWRGTLHLSYRLNLTILHILMTLILKQNPQISTLKRQSNKHKQKEREHK